MFNRNAKLHTLAWNFALKLNEEEKNPGYGRQSISPPMRIVAPIPKNPASKAKFAKKQTIFCGSFTLFMSKSF